MSWRTSLAGLLAGLSALAALPDVPPWLRTFAIVVGAVAVAMLGALARDSAVVPPVLPAARAVDPPNPDAVPRVVLPSYADAVQVTGARKGEP